MKEFNEKKNMSCMLIEDFVKDMGYRFEDWQRYLLDKVRNKQYVGEKEYSNFEMWIAQVHAIQEIAGLLGRTCYIAYDDRRLASAFQDIENVCERTVQYAKMVVETLNLYIKYDEEITRQVLENLTDFVYSQTKILSTMAKDIIDTKPVDMLTNHE